MNTELTPLNTTEDESITFETSRDYYLENTEQSTAGPLREGFTPDTAIDEILKDTRTMCVTLHDREKGPISWPLLTPITNCSDYRSDYFDRMPEGCNNTYYLSLPPQHLQQSASEQEAIGEALLQYMHDGSLLVYDEYNGERKVEQIQECLAHVSDIAIEIDEFIDQKNNTPAAAVQFSVPIRFKHSQEAAESTRGLLTPQDTEPDTIFIDNDPDVDLVDDLWHIYQQQFESLTDDFPLQLFGTEEQFHLMLRNSSMHTAVRFEDDKPVAMATFTDDIKACGWLNTSFYAEAFPDEEIIHCLAIASSPDRRGMIYSADIVSAFARKVAEAGINFRLTLQCTNISADYIPRIVDRGIRNYTDIAEETKVAEFGRYNYRGVRLAPTLRQTHNLDTTSR